MQEKNITVLLIEDNPADIRLITEMIRESVSIEGNVENIPLLEDGLKRISENDIDVLLLDLSLPDSSGLETFRRIQKAAPDIPVIILSGNEDEKIAIEAVRGGAQDYLVKGQIFMKLLEHSIRYSIERKNILRKIAQAKEEWENTFDAIPDIILIIDVNKRITRANKAIADKLGLKREDIIGKHCYSILHGEEAPPPYCPHNRTYEDGREHNVEYYEDRLGGYYLFTSTPVLDSEGVLKSVVEVGRDITVRKQMEKKLVKTATTDELTKLNNSRGFFNLADKQCKIAERTGRKMALLYVDLDNMKTINDELGHKAGDQALMDTAEILKNTFREADVIGRLGGDEFAVLMTEIYLDNIETVIRGHIQESLEVFNKKRKRQYKLSLSTGFSYFDPDMPYSINKLLNIADASMCKDKKSLKRERQPVLSFISKRIFNRYKLNKDCFAELGDGGRVEITNISIGGMSLKSPKMLDQDSMLTVTLNSPDKEEFDLKGRVVWSYSMAVKADEVDHGKASFCMAGLVFTELDDDLRNVLEKYINKYSY